MLTWTRTSLVTAALLAACAGGAAAAQDVPPAGALSAEQVTAKLSAAGYTNVHDVEFDDGAWEAEALASSGKPVDLVVDAKSGAVTSETPD